MRHTEAVRLAFFAAVGLLALAGVVFAVAQKNGGDSHPISAALIDAPTPTPQAQPGRTPASRRRRTRPAAPPVAAPAMFARSQGCGLAPEAGDFVESVSTGDGDRQYRLHVPATYSAAVAVPLVLTFHGSSQSALEQETYSQLAPFADAHGFILVTPEGSGYPPGWEIPGFYHEQGYDDVAAMLAVIAQVKAERCIDEDRVYATGMSNGAEMASLLGCREPRVFAAIAAVSGVIFDACAAPGLPVIAFHGTDDYNVPFELIPGAVASWARLNGCAAAAPEVETFTEHVTVTGYGDCGGRDVVLFVIEAGGHTWPGAEDGAGGAGPVTHEISANELLWEFFIAHPRPAQPASIAASVSDTTPRGGEPAAAAQAAPASAPGR